MINRTAITQWNKIVPWNDNAQVEQDLIISRALVAIFSDEFLASQLGSAVVTQATIENRKGGKRTFLGFFDPSVRPHFEADKLSYTIPMSRFKKMYETMRQSCLFDTHAWGKIKERMNG